MRIEKSFMILSIVSYKFYNQNNNIKICFMRVKKEEGVLYFFFFFFFLPAGVRVNLIVLYLHE